MTTKYIVNNVTGQTIDGNITILGEGNGTLNVPSNGFTAGSSFTALMVGHFGANNNNMIYSELFFLNKVY